MRTFIAAAAALAGLGLVAAGPAVAQGCGGGMCAMPAAVGQQQATPGVSAPQAAPQAAPGTGIMGGMGMCGCCRQMAMTQPGTQGGSPPAPDGMGTGGDPGTGSTPPPPAQ